MYDTLIVTPLRDMMTQVLGFIPTLLLGLGILIIGWLLSRGICSFMEHFFKVIEFDKIADKLGVSKFLKTGGIKRSPGDLLACLTYCVLMIMVLILTVKALGLTVGSHLIDAMLGYVPSVISGVLILIIGMYLARFVSVIVYITAKNTDMPSPATLSRITKLAIMFYVTIMFLKEIGFVGLFVGVNYTIFMTGVVFALALSFGLAGKEVAAKYLDVLKKGS